MKLRLFVFYIDNVSQVIEEGPIVQIDQIDRTSLWCLEDLVFNSVWVVKSTIFYLREYQNDTFKYPSLVVVHLG